MRGSNHKGERKMTETEIKELINMLKKEGCNSKKQAIEYLEGKLKIFKIGVRIKIINPRYSYYKKMGKIVDIFRRGLLETDLEVKE